MRNKYTNKFLLFIVCINAILIFWISPCFVYAESEYEELPMMGTSTSFSDSQTNPKNGNASAAGRILIESTAQDFSYAESIKFDYSMYAYAYGGSAQVTLSAYFKDATTNEVIAYFPSWKTTLEFLDFASGGTTASSKTNTAEINLTGFMQSHDCSNAIFVIDLGGRGYVAGETKHTTTVSGSVSNIMIKKTPQSPYFSGFPGDGNLTTVNVVDGDPVALSVLGVFPNGKENYIWQKYKKKEAPNYNYMNNEEKKVTASEDPATQITSISYPEGYNWSEDTNAGNWETVSGVYGAEGGPNTYRFKADIGTHDETYYRVILQDPTDTTMYCLPNWVVRVNVVDASFNQLEVYSLLGDRVNIGQKMTPNELLAVLLYNGNKAQVEINLDGLVFTADKVISESPESLVNERVHLYVYTEDGSGNPSVKDVEGVITAYAGGAYTIGEETINVSEIIGSYYVNEQGISEITVEQGENTYLCSKYALGVVGRAYSSDEATNVLAIGDKVTFAYRDDSENKHHIIGYITGLDKTSGLKYQINGTTIDPSKIDWCCYSKSAELKLVGEDLEGPTIYVNDSAHADKTYSKLTKDGTDASKNVPLTTTLVEEYNTTGILTKYVSEYQTNETDNKYELKVYATDNITTPTESVPTPEKIVFQWYGPFESVEEGKEAIAGSTTTALTASQGAEGPALTLLGSEAKNGVYICKAKDEASNISLAVFELNIWDLEKPKFTLATLDPDDTVFTKAKSLTVMASDNYALHDKPYAFSTTKSIPAKDSPLWQMSNSYFITEPGNYYFFARDVFGNVAASYDPETAESLNGQEGGFDFGGDGEISIENVDDTPPTITSLIISGDEDCLAADGSYDKYKISVSATDNVSDILTFNIIDTNTNTVIQTATAGGALATTGASVTFGNIPEDGFYDVEVVDACGNKSKQSTGIRGLGSGDDVLSTFGITFSRSPLSYTKGNVTLKLTIDNEDKLYSGNCFNLYKGDTSVTGWVDINHKTFTITENGTYTLHIKDKDGNTFSSNTIAVNNIDRHKPQITANVSNGKITINMTDCIVEGDADYGKNYAESGLHHLSITVPSGEKKVLAVYGDGDGTSLSEKAMLTHIYEIEELGDYAIEVEDMAGNITLAAEENGGVIKIEDITPNNPLFEGTTEEIANKISAAITAMPTAWTNGNVNVTFTGDNTGFASVPYSWDGGDSFTTKSSTVLIANQPVTLKIKDRYGNTYSSNPIDVTNIDKTAPMISAEEPSGNEGTVKINLTDNDSGIDRLCAVNGTTESVLATYDGEKSAVFNGTVKENGAYKFVVYDKAGNSNSQTLIVSRAKSSNNGGNNTGNNNNTYTEPEIEYVEIETWIPSDVIYQDQPYAVPYYVYGGDYGSGYGYGGDYGYGYDYGTTSYGASNAPAAAPVYSTSPTVKSTSDSTKSASTSTSSKTAKEADTSGSENLKNAKLVVSSSTNKMNTNNPVADKNKIDSSTNKENSKDESNTITEPDKTNAAITDSENNKFTANQSSPQDNQKKGFNWWIVIAVLCALGIVALGMFVIYPMIKDKMLEKQFSNGSESDDEEDEEDEDDEFEDDDDDEEDEDE